MRTIIRSSDLLPPFFSIDRYKDMDRLSANTWFYLLEARFLINQEILEGRGLEFWLGKNVLNTDEEQEAIKLLLEYFFKNPLNPNLSINYKKQNGENICIQISNPKNNGFMKKPFTSI